MILRLKLLLGFALAADVFSYLTRMNEASTRAGERERGGGGRGGGLTIFFFCSWYYFGMAFLMQFKFKTGSLEGYVIGSWTPLHRFRLLEIAININMLKKITWNFNRVAESCFFHSAYILGK